MTRFGTICLIVLALVCIAGRASSQHPKNPKKPPAATTQPVPDSLDAAPKADDATEANKEKAKTHFERGLALFEEEAWDAALVEFQKSRELFPTRAATKNAAISLRRLHRFDEALDTFDALLREFPNLPPSDKALVEREVSELRSRVGTVDIRMTEAGATIVIDGRERGTSPTSAPIRVSVGSHLVRAFKKGFGPYERRVDVSGGENVAVDVKLSPLTQSGTLKVSESSGKIADVVVDNVVVGKTPWEGPLPLGNHTVLLRGEGNLGTSPRGADIAFGRETSLALALEALESQLRVEPTPVAAEVRVDGVSVGRGMWEGRLRPGSHKVEILAEGYLRVTRRVTLKRGKREVVSAALERDPNSPLWREREVARFFVQPTIGAVIAPTLGSDLDSTCESGCDKSLAQGGVAWARAGYNLSSAVSVSFDVGYLIVRQKLEARAAELEPVGRPKNPGEAFDKLWLRGLLVGLSVGARTSAAWPLTFRLGGGVLLGTVSDERSGRFRTSANPTVVSYDIGKLEQSDPARYAYAAPELRIGRRLGPESEVSIGVQALLMYALARPRWPNDTPVLTGNCGIAPSPSCVTDGEAVFAADALTAQTVFLFSPQLALRLEL